MRLPMPTAFSLLNPLSLRATHAHSYAQVSRIKEKVEEQSGVPPPQQRLIFAGRQMYVPLYALAFSPTLHKSRRLTSWMQAGR